MAKDYSELTFEEQIELDTTEAEERKQAMIELNKSIHDKIFDYKKLGEIALMWGFGGFLPGKIGRWLAPATGPFSAILTILCNPQSLSDSNAMTSYITAKCGSDELAMRTIFKGPTNLACLLNMSTFMQSHKATYKSFFQKGTDSVKEYIIRITQMTHLAYSLINQEELNKATDNGEKEISEDEIRKYVYYQDKDDNNIHDLLMGGFILKAIFKNVDEDLIINLASKKPQATIQFWNNTFDIMFGTNNIERRYKHFDSYLVGVLKNLLTRDERTPEQHNPLVQLIIKNFENVGLKGFVGVGLAYFLLYNVCLINFQLYIYDKIPYKTYIDNCSNLLYDLMNTKTTKEKLLNISISQYIPNKLFKEFFTNYPMIDLFQINYAYVNKYKNNMFNALMKYSLVLRYYIALRKYSPFLVSLAHSKTIVNTGSIEDVLKALNNNNSKKWFYIVPTVALLLGSILIIIKIYKNKNRNRR
jgi:hypothetical protein